MQASTKSPFEYLESITDTWAMDGNISAMTVYSRATGPGTLTNLVYMFARVMEVARSDVNLYGCVGHERLRSIWQSIFVSIASLR